MEAEHPDQVEECEQPQGFFARIHGDWIEVFAAVLLALATVASAWSAYQASRWHGVEAESFNQANAKRIEAAEYIDIAEQEYVLDTELFVEYSAVLYAGDQAAVEYFENTLFRDEMRVAVEAWKAADPWNNPDAPATPFEMPEYRSSNREKGKELQSEANDQTTLASDSIQHADNYVLLTVICASILFFAGISTKFKSPNIRIGTISLGALIFIVSFIILLIMPVH